LGNRLKEVLQEEEEEENYKEFLFYEEETYNGLKDALEDK